MKKGKSSPADSKRKRINVAIPVPEIAPKVILEQKAEAEEDQTVSVSEKKDSSGIKEPDSDFKSSNNQSSK